MTDQKLPILLTGATGYIGGRLLPRLLQKGHRVRCMARHPEVLATQLKSGAEVISGDVILRESLTPAFQGMEVAYYLIHSLGSGADFEEQEFRGAKNFADAAQQAGVKKIIYLGGLGSQDSDLSKHLRSRHQVGEVLRASGIPVIEFRASIILGSGSLSFEMVRALTERLPVMITPKWVRTPAQPIAIEDVLQYLLLALDPELSTSQIFEIGGADMVSYRDIMKEYARQRGLKRLMIKVPVLTPRLSSLWLHLVTPLFARVGRKLVESIRNPTLVKNPAALQVFPIRPMGMRQAIERALKNEDKEFAETHWSDALSSAGSIPYGGIRLRNRIVDSRSVHLELRPEQAFQPVESIGGTHGWYYANFLWRFRGAIDRLIGGVGLRRGRRDPNHLKVGDALDFWRVEAFDPPKKILLRAEMKLPGRAWLEFETDPTDSGCTLTQTALFDPRGLEGLAYWYLLYPIHRLIFRGMLKAIARRAQGA